MSKGTHKILLKVAVSLLINIWNFLVHFKLLGNLWKKIVQKLQTLNFFTSNKEDYISGRRNLSKFKRRYFLSNDAFLLQSLAFAFSKQNCWGLPLNNVMTRILETGICQKMMRHSYMKYRKIFTADDRNSEKVLAFQEPLCSGCVRMCVPGCVRSSYCSDCG